MMASKTTATSARIYPKGLTPVAGYSGLTSRTGPQWLLGVRGGAFLSASINGG